MSKFDIGEHAVLKRDLVITLEKGHSVFIAESESDSEKTYTHIGYNFYKSDLDLVDFRGDYLKSNRYTLSQLIKASEFKAIDLSVQMGKERTYLSSTASESRFNSRGDIDQVKLDEIKLNMSLAELGLKIKRGGLSRETISAEKPDFTFDIPKELEDENQTIDAWFKSLKTSEDASKAFIFLHKYIEKYGESLPNFEKDRLFFELDQKTREIWEDEFKSKIDSHQGRTKLAEKPKCSVRDLTDDEKDQIKRDRWIYEKPKHNLNIFAILVTIAILVILFSIGYKYIF